MISYHQAFDVYHTCFRMLFFLHKKKVKTIEVDRLRIFDFIFLFPEDLHNIQMPAGTIKIRNQFSKNKYNSIPNRKRVFYQIGKYFELAIKCLLSYEIIEVEDYKDGKITLVNNDIVDRITSAYENSINAELIDLLHDEFLDMSLYDLKRRTELIEYRYDLPST